MTQKLLYEEESYLIRGCCFELYKELGSQHKESIYQKGLEIKLNNSGLKTEREIRIPVKVDNKFVGNYTPDFIVNDSIILELKAKPILTKQDIQQFWHYLKTTNYKLGFLINFGKPGGVQIIRRIYDSARRKTQK
jgi:GxxExxY protein